MMQGGAQVEHPALDGVVVVPGRAQFVEVECHGLKGDARRGADVRIELAVFGQDTEKAAIAFPSGIDRPGRQRVGITRAVQPRDRVCAGAPALLVLPWPALNRQDDGRFFDPWAWL